MKPTLFYLCAPSGAGKNALLSALQNIQNAPYIAIRTITRPADATEASEPVTEPEFQRLKTLGVFAMDWVAHGFSYGIRSTELEKADQIIINGSRAHWPIAKQQWPELALVTITVSEAILKSRLIARARESEFEIAARLKRNRQLANDLRLETPFCNITNDGTPQDMAAALMEAIACTSN